MFKIGLVFPESFLFLCREMEKRLTQEGFEVMIGLSEGPIDENTKKSFLEQADIYVTAGLEKIMANDLSKATRLRLIQRFGTGYENVDCAAAGERGIYVANIPGGNSDSVADLTIAVILALLRHILQADVALRKGVWRFWIGHELAGKILGIIGLGTIGKRVAIRAKAHGMTVLAYDTHPDLEFAAKYNITIVSKNELLKTADVISLHVPLNENTRNLISETELKLMKPTAYLINTARGGLVNEAALVKALREGWIAGAALDVFSTEPLTGNEEILHFDNVVLTPHIGGSTFEALQRLASVAVENCRRVARGEPPLYVVNQPLKIRR